MLRRHFWLCCVLGGLLLGCSSNEETPTEPNPPLFDAAATTVFDTGSRASLRGLDAFSDDVVWASGSQGTLLFTINGGRTWGERNIRSARSLDLRDIAVLDELRLVVMSAGVGDASRIFLSTDGGFLWSTVWSNARPDGFLDGLAFWDSQRGLAYGDPVDGHFQVLRTDDGGVTWRELPPDTLPPARDGEAGFAASGTGIAVAGSDHAWFCTGGVERVRVFRTENGGASWSVHDTPLPVAASSAGGFSLAFRDTQHGVLVGGDYLQAFSSEANCAITDDGGFTWRAITELPPSGHRSCVAARPGGDEWWTVGQAGGDLSLDDGATWLALESAGWHCIDFSSRDVAWFAGSDGRVGRWSAPR